MTLLNFGHPLTPDQLAAIEGECGQAVDRVIRAAPRFDHDQPFAPQARALVDATALAPDEWQTRPLLVNLPTHSVIAALVLAEIHGRAGYFPAIVRLRPVAGSTPPRFEFAEILNLQATRDQARAQR